MKRESAFDDFIIQNFVFAADHNIQDKEELRQIAQSYDVILAGSDQIWNSVSLDPLYLLQSISAEKKMSYGSSLSVQEIKPVDEPIYRQALSTFKAISIRDRKCRAQLERIVGKPIATVVDPVILLGRNALIQSAQEIISDPYIFCYFLGSKKEHRLFATTEAKKRNLQIHAVINVGSNYSADRPLKSVADWDVDPWKFVGYIKNASLVITDSFHATVIATLCHTQFIVLEKDSKRPEQNNRILEFLDSTRLRDRWEQKDTNNNINENQWLQSDRALMEMRKNRLIGWFRTYDKKNKCYCISIYILRLIALVFRAKRKHKMTNTIKIIQHNQCSACYACVNVCPQKCIVMNKEDTGSLYPHIIETKCVKCGKCLNICPAVNDIPQNTPVEVFAAFSKDNNEREMSTSGGVATVIAKKIIACGGVVYGAAMIKSEIRHIRVSSYEDVEKIQGSKYVHSHLKDIYKDIKIDVQHHIPVVFIGTPCQVAGVKQYLKIIPDNVFFIDLLCHGVTSLDCFLNGLCLETDKKISKVIFRDNNHYCLQGYDEHEKHIFSIPCRASYWYNGFVEGYFFRENCYACKYARKERIGDITIGDFWGLQSDFNSYKGVNFIAVNTQKGENIWSKVQSSIRFEVRYLEEEIPFNHALSSPADKPKEYERFKKIYKVMGARLALVFEYPKKTVFIVIRRMIRKHKQIYSFVSKIPAIGSKFSDYPE